MDGSAATIILRVDVIRFGLGLRALRRRRAWTQSALAARSGVSRSVVWRLERGHADSVTVATLVTVAGALGARVDLRLLWQGEALDRLLDADHATLVERLLALLGEAAWERATEVSFHVDGERGAFDVLAYHRPTRTLLVVEVKSVVPDLQALLHGLDRKARVAPRVARALDRDWTPERIARLLVLPDERTARRRVADHRAIFQTALPDRTVAVRRWLRAPDGPLAGVLFLPDARHVSARHRVRAPRRS